MSTDRGQASTLFAAVLALSVLLSLVVAGAVTQTGTTADLNLNEHSNEGTPDVPSISYAVACVVGTELDADDALDVDITFTDEGEPGEFFTAEFTSDVEIDYLVLKGGQHMEEFAFDGATAGNATFGTGAIVDPARPNNAPCRPGDGGIKQNEGGVEETVFSPVN
ncbi:hypothetical protein C2R22_20950 [Salinigranum rubrum]|uniref:Uncharacterized protein n=1 Tax=Salinigranum rubrum TaxID=755307 RepID=A0A2I8VRJ0_9EURY|nr:hypothetical protein [Salinigranum rubrum]AUV83809.1 hypothetical protein C2R22_20950 [Salinigranum rubrum]